MFKRVLAYALALSLTLGLVPTSYAVDNVKEVNLIKNSGFEQGSTNNINDYSKVNTFNGKKSAEFSLDTENKVSGNSSLKFYSVDNDTRSYIDQVVTVEPNTKYKLSANIKTQNIAGGSAAIFLYEKPNGTTDTSKITKLEGTGTSDWTLKNAEITTAHDTTQIVVRIIIGSTWDSKKGSTAWIDDLKLVKEETQIISVTDVEVLQTLSVNQNEVKQLIPIISPQTATNKKVLFESDNEKIATVSTDGIIKGISEGVANIKVTTIDGSFTDTCKVTVLKSGDESKNLFTNGSFESTSILSESNSNFKYWQNGEAPIYWSNLFKPSGKDVAQFSIDTTIFSEGEKSVYIKGDNSNTRTAFNSTQFIDDATKAYKLSVDIKTNNVEGTGVYLRTQYFSTKKLGDGPATPMIKGTTDWTTYEMFMTDIPVGTQKIVVDIFLENASGEAWIDNIKLEETYTLVLNTQSEKLNIGDKFQLIGQFTPEQIDKKITWTSSDDSVATVSETGEVFAVSGGVVKITAKTEDGQSATCEIEIDNPEYAKYYSVIRQKWQDRLTLNNLEDKTSDNYQNSMENLDIKVLELWQSLIKEDNREKLWEDLDILKKSSHITIAYSNLKSMATAYASNGSKYYHNEELLKDTLAGIDWMYDNCYNENVVENKGKIYDNWYDWNISAPKALNDILILLYDKISVETKEESIRTIEYYNSDPYVAVGIYNNIINMTGANLLDKLVVKAITGIISESGKNLNIVKDGVSTVLPYVTSGDGFYEDGSFIQHESIPYIGGYGSVLMTGLSQILFITEDTPWEITDPNLSNSYDWITNGFEPLYYKGSLMDMVSGRGVTRENSNDRAKARGSLIKILSLSNTAPEHIKNDLLGFVKENIIYGMQHDENYLSGTNVNDIIMIEELLNDESIPARGDLTLHKTYGSQDRVVHHFNGVALGISMYSDRISSFEYGNGENKKGWHTSDGATYLYNDDLSQFSDDYWPTVDMNRLAGTTSDNSNGTIKDWHKIKSSKDFVGGSTIYDLYGATVMEFELEDKFSTLNGKKSWFAFDDEVVAVGSSINATDDRLVETIVENRKIKDTNDNTFIVDGTEILSENGEINLEDVSWAFLEGNVGTDNIGYYFPESSDVSFKKETRTGSWNEINNGGSNDEIIKNYLSIAIEHGVNPTEGQYSYVLLPNKTQAEVSTYADKSDIEIISNTDKAHAVYEKSLKMLGINFFEETTVKNVTATDKASVMIHEKGQDYTIALSDPTHKKDSITLYLDGEYQLKSGTADVNIIDGKTEIIFNTKNQDGASIIIEVVKKNSGGGGSSSGGSSTSPTIDKETLSNDDGSTTVTETNNKTGNITVTTKYPNGNTITQITDKDGNEEINVSGIKTPNTTIIIPIDEKLNSGHVAVIVNSDGTKEIIQDSILVEYGMKIVLDKNAQIEIIDNSKSFTDISKDEWFYDSVNFATSRELFNGTSDNEFSPNETTTHAMIWTVLYRYSNSEVSSNESNWYSDSQKWAKEAGISDSNNPDENITREQLVSNLYRLAGSPAVSSNITNKFSDSAKISDYSAMTWAINEGIIMGKSNDILDPTSNVTRAEVATILERYISN